MLPPQQNNSFCVLHKQIEYGYPRKLQSPAEFCSNSEGEKKDNSFSGSGAETHSKLTSPPFGIDCCASRCYGTQPVHTVLVNRQIYSMKISALVVLKTSARKFEHVPYLECFSPSHFLFIYHARNYSILKWGELFIFRIRRSRVFVARTCIGSPVPERYITAE